MDYFVKYVNEHCGSTAKEHLSVLNDQHLVIWGQFASNGHIVAEPTYKQMKQNDFSLFALDKTVALLKMHVIDVMRIEEVQQNNMWEYIPAYYRDTVQCSLYYLIDKIEILPIDYLANIISISSNRPLSEQARGNVCGHAPWRVRELSDEEKTIPDTEMLVVPIEEDVPEVSIVETQYSITENNTPDSNYSVYRYYSKSACKVYIGLTNDVARRRKEHENPVTWAKHPKTYLYTAFAFLGVSDFEFVVLHSGLTKEEAEQKEALEIRIHNSYYPNGFNERNEDRHLSAEILAKLQR